MASKHRFGDPDAPFRFCTKTKQDGTPCRAVALKCSEYCYFHAPRNEKAAARAARERARKKVYNAPRRVGPLQYARRLRDEKLKGDQRAALEAVGRLWPAERCPPAEIEAAVAEEVGKAHYDRMFRCWKWLLCAAFADREAGTIADVEWRRAVHDHSPAALDWWRVGVVQAAKDDPEALMRGETPLPPFIGDRLPEDRRRWEQRALERARKAERREESEATLAARRDIDKTLAELDAEARAAAESDREELAALGLADDDEEADGGPNR